MLYITFLVLNLLIRSLHFLSQSPNFSSSHFLHFIIIIIIFLNCSLSAVKVLQQN